MNVNSQDAPIYNFILSGAFVKVITRNVQQYNLKLSLEDAEGEVCLYIAQQINNGQLNKTITNKEAINKIINKALKEYQRKNICRCQQADFPNYKNHKCKGNILTHHECEKYTEEMFDQMKVSYAMYDEIGMFGNQKMWGDKEKAEYFRNERNLSLSKISRDLRPALEQIISMDRRKEVKNLYSKAKELFREKNKDFYKLLTLRFPEEDEETKKDVKPYTLEELAKVLGYKVVSGVSALLKRMIKYIHKEFNFELQDISIYYRNWG